MLRLEFETPEQFYIAVQSLHDVVEYRQFETLSGREIRLPIESRLYVDGAFEVSSETFETYSPSTGAKLADVSAAADSHVDAAVKGAKRASEEWREISIWDRRERVELVANSLEQSAEELTRLEVADNGSCISKLADDIQKASKSLRYFAGIAPELKGETIPTEPGTVDFTKREPYGVVGAIIPFNHPAAFVARKLGPAVLAGNGIVIKPSEYTPLSALYIAHLLDGLDVFPDGLVNILPGGPETGEAVVTHPGVKMVSLVGSPHTGKAVMRNAAQNLSNLLLELGGKNPVVVFPDTDAETAAEGIVDGMNLQWQGQSCGSASRLFLHSDIYESVLDEVVTRLESLTIGDPFEYETDIGAVVSGRQLEKVTSYVNDAVDRDARLLTGGAKPEFPQSGNFFQPTVLEPPLGSSIATEETFGPVLSVFSWEDWETMLHNANDVDYGLTASVWTSDLDKAHRTVDRLEAGYIWVNNHSTHYLGAPFGGFGESGLGKTECLEELLEHTRLKNVNITLQG